MNRSRLLIVVALVLFAPCLLFAGSQSEEVDATMEGGNQAPAFAAMVEAGTLEPLSERIPANPFVLETADGREGEYGGTILGWYQKPNINDYMMYQHFWYTRMVDMEPEYGPNRTIQVRDGLADEWSMSSDGRTFTFHIREGLKWSDGELFTTEDVLFWREAVSKNATLRDVMVVNAYENAELGIVDDYTFTWTFDDPQWDFLQKMAADEKYHPRWFAFPAHYLKQFHPH